MRASDRRFYACEFRPCFLASRAGLPSASSSHERSVSAPGTQSSSVGESDSLTRYATPSQKPPRIFTRNAARSRMLILRGSPAASRLVICIARRATTESERTCAATCSGNSAPTTSIASRRPCAVPIHGIFFRNQRPHIADPHQPFPEMFCAVHADEHQLVFDRKRRDFAAVDGDVGATLKQFFYRQSPRVIPKRSLGVEFDEKLCARLVESILAGKLRCLYGAERHRGRVPERNHRFGRTLNVLVANDQIEIAVLPPSRLAVASHRQRRPFGDQRLYTQTRKALEQAEHLRDQA